ncbi:MAG: DUF2971 domain-containing protein [Bacteroidales bacterium]|nr:DUF2971 domain-containing protein [Bacteroidales bacterium]
MLLYHFFKSKHALDSIENKHIKIALLTELNDPLELLPIFTKKRDLISWEETKTNFAQKHGIICFSKIWYDPVMWSHYADNHKGIVLGFKINDDKFQEVIYPKNDQRARLLIKNKWDTGTDKTPRGNALVLWSKYKSWQYEQEVRAWVDFDETVTTVKTKEKVIKYLPTIKNKIVLHSIMLGLNCDQKVSGILKALHTSNYSNVNIYKICLSQHSYSLKRKKIKIAPGEETA